MTISRPLEKALLSAFLGGLLYANTASGALVAQYLFDGNANDTSGNALNGTVVGATLTAGRSGNPNSAYFFDGTSSYITIADNDLLEVDNVRSVTAWINKKDEVGSGLNYGIVSKYQNDTPGEPGWSLTAKTDAGVTTPSAYFKDSSGNTADYSPGISLNEWHFVALTYDDSLSLLSIFVDGVATSITSDAFYSGGNSRNMVIGGAYSFGVVNAWSRFHGTIDDVQIFDHTLSNSELQQLYGVPLPATLALIVWGILPLALRRYSSRLRRRRISSTSP